MQDETKQTETPKEEEKVMYLPESLDVEDGTLWINSRLLLSSHTNEPL